jgi:hypothetical protein
MVSGIGARLVFEFQWRTDPDWYLVGRRRPQNESGTRRHAIQWIVTPIYLLFKSTTRSQCSAMP